MKTLMLTLIAAGALLAGCSGEAEPAEPPPSEDALTTTDTASTTDTAPTTEAPQDDVVETSAPPAVVETTEAAGPPELPEAATEDSETGAKTFAVHYIEIINYTSTNPEVGLLEQLSAPTCGTCTNFANSVADSIDPRITSAGDIFEISDSVAVHYPADSEANVRVTTFQVGQDYTDPSGAIVDSIQDEDAVMSFQLVWDGSWVVEQLRIEKL